jgi:hypothetical protein
MTASTNLDEDLPVIVNVYPFLLTNTFRQNPFVDRTTGAEMAYAYGPPE